MGARERWDRLLAPNWGARAWFACECERFVSAKVLWAMGVGFVWPEYKNSIDSSAEAPMQRTAITKEEREDANRDICCIN